MHAPQEVVTQFLGRGALEGEDAAAQRIDSGEDLSDGAVLPGGVHALEDHEQGVALVGPELLDEGAEPPVEIRKGLLPVLAGSPRGSAGVEVLKPEISAGVDPAARKEVHVHRLSAGSRRGNTRGRTGVGRLRGRGLAR